VSTEKKERKKYGLLPPQIAESDSWVIVSLDLVGHFTIMVGLFTIMVGLFSIKPQSKIHSLLAITMIDPATQWFVIVKATIFKLSKWDTL
jgi:hypothetical protein